jgi:integrase
MERASGKSGVARTIPLSAAATTLLDGIRPAQTTPDSLIFGSHRRGGSGRQTDDTMQNLIRQKMAVRYTVHGFRSSFMDWVAEVHPQRLQEAERALDHQIGNLGLPRFRGRLSIWESRPVDATAL